MKKNTVVKLYSLATQAVPALLSGVQPLLPCPDEWRGNRSSCSLLELHVWKGKLLAYVPASLLLILSLASEHTPVLGQENALVNEHVGRDVCSRTEHHPGPAVKPGFAIINIPQVSGKVIPFLFYTNFVLLVDSQVARASSKWGPPERSLHKQCDNRPYFHLPCCSH